MKEKPKITFNEYLAMFWQVKVLVVAWLSIIKISSVTANTQNIGSGKIVGGFLDFIENVPWLASLHSNPRGRYCGANIIHHRLLLTCCHCTYLKPAATFYVLVGSTNLNDHGQRFNVMSKMQHPDYKPQSYDFDFCMLKIYGSFIFDMKVQKIELPVGNVLNPGLSCAVSGWGATVNGGYQEDLLRSVDINLIDHKTCQNIYGVHVITDQMFCAGAKGTFAF